MYEYVIINRNIINNNALSRQYTFSHSLTDHTQTNNTAQKVGTMPLTQNAQIILRILTHSLLIKYLEIIVN